MGKSTAYEFMKTYEVFGNFQHAGNLEGMKRRAINVLTSAMSNKNVDKETKEKILEEVKEQTEEKGKPLTEKEIKEITAPYLEQIEALKKEKEQLSITLENTDVRIDNVKSYMQSQIDAKEKELKKAQETSENQKKQIQELNSKISAKEKALDEIQTLKEELEDKQLNLESFIIAQANVMANDEINKEKETLDKQIKELKAKEAKLEKELKQAESLRTTAQKQKENFDLTTNWLNSFQLTNEYLNEITGKLKQYKKELEKTPDLSQFDDEEKANLEKAIQDQVVDFNDNLHKLGGAINYLNGTVVKFNNHALRVINAEVSDG